MALRPFRNSYVFQLDHITGRATIATTTHNPRRSVIDLYIIMSY